MLKCVLHIAVFICEMCDLISGIRKAKRRGEFRTSTGLRRTIDKILRYHLALFMLNMIDAAHIFSFWYLNGWWEFHVPCFPLFSTIGAMGEGVIEVKSIFEKAEEKDKAKYIELGHILAEIAKHKDANEAIEKLNEFITKK